MNRAEFVKMIQEAGNLPDQQSAEDGALVVLSLLSHRLTPEESQDVKDQLSQDMKRLWSSDTWISNFLSLSGEQQLRYRKKEELYSLVQNEIEKRQLPIGAEQLTTTVFHALKEQISEGEIEDIAAQLPEDIEEIWLAA
jgi:uncharacterized protein (DUF2267 family)